MDIDQNHEKPQSKVSKQSWRFNWHLPCLLLWEGGGHLDSWQLVGCCKSSMEWCWDLGEKCLQFHHWNDVAISHVASENVRSLRTSQMCDVQKRESSLSATCRRFLDLLFFLHLERMQSWHAETVLRKMKCPLRHQGCLRHKRDK